MAVFVMSFVVLLAIMLAMSVGVLLGRKPIKGSCGGMSAIGMDTACDVCGGNPQKCEEEQERGVSSKKAAEKLSYDATKSGAAD